MKRSLAEYKLPTHCYASQKEIKTTEHDVVVILAGLSSNILEHLGNAEWGQALRFPGKTKRNGRSVGQRRTSWGMRVPSAAVGLEQSLRNWRQRVRRPRWGRCQAP